ncbi:MAG: anthranilate phosphoribosyltransferase [Candidatus Atribacteria bacterium]
MFKELLNKVVIGENLKEKEACWAMNEIMQGKVTAAQIASFLTALRIKRETVEEITGCAIAMRKNAISIKDTFPLTVDTCGTGGDCKGTFNISTVTAFVVAGAGIRVAKHGNRGVSSKSGSADVLEALGVNIGLSPDQVEKCLEEVGIAFLFAPVFHPAMRHALEPRREIGFRTIFNLLGPLTNPAKVKYQVLGVYSSELTELMARALHGLGVRNAMVVHGEDGMDEISINSSTKITRLKNAEIETFYLEPEELGLSRYRLEDIKGGNALINANIALNILNRDKGPHREIVLMNAAAALVVCGVVNGMREGMKMATQVIDSKVALKKLEDLREYTKRLA